MRCLIISSNRSKYPYVTHLPVLLHVPRQIKVGSILEFGSGLFSTVLFLDKLAYPDLVRLRAYENDKDWLSAVRNRVGGDKKAEIIFVNGEIGSAAKVIDYRGYDLIFVDDSTSISKRSNTIRQVSENCDSRTVVIIHDYENVEYQQAARGFRFHHTLTALNPNTGVLWNEEHIINADKLAKLNALMVMVGKDDHLSLQDIGYWLNKFDEFGL